MTRELQDKAKEFMAKNEWENAIPFWEQAQASEPDNHFVTGQLAFCHSRLRHHSEAIALYKKLCEVEPNQPRWPYSLGYQYYDQQQWDQAIIHFDQALTIQPDYIVVLYRKGYALAQLHESKRGQALTVLEQCRSAYHALTDEDIKKRERKHYADACYQQGKIFAALKRHDKAQERLQEASEIINDADIHYALGDSYLSSGQIADAVTSLETAQRLSEKPAHYIIDRLIRAYAAASQRDKAIKIFEQAPPFIRDRAYILRDMADVFIELEDWIRAEQTLKLAVRKDRRNHYGHYHLGIVYLHQQKWAEAAKEFKEAVLLRQKHYKIPFPEAEQALNKLLEEHPEAGSEPSQEIWPGSETGRPVGRVKKFFSDKGFGFLEVADNDQDLFFHITQVEGQNSVNEGDFLEYTLTQGKKGPQAINLRVIQKQ